MSYAVYGYESRVCYYKEPHATKTDCVRFLNATYINFRKTLSSGKPSKVSVSKVFPEPLRIVKY